MLQASMFSATSASDTRTLVERVRDAVASLGCDRVWARYVGPHVLLGLRGDDAFARVTPLGGGSYGLAFRSLDDGPARAARPLATRPPQRWEPMLLVDELADVVEHALVAVDALPA
jgi:hypothetical protein